MATDSETNEPRRRGGWAWLFAGCLLFVLLAFVIPLSLPPYSHPPQSAHFLMTTNGIVGPQLPTFLKALTPTEAARLTDWLAAGTNSAVYAFTNREVCTVYLFPFVTMANPSGGKSSHTGPLLNVPDFSGIRVEPGGVAELLVPIPTELGTWQPEFGYTLNSCSPTYPGYLKYKDLPESLVCLLTGKSFASSTIRIQTDRPMMSPLSLANTNATK